MKQVINVCHATIVAFALAAVAAASSSSSVAGTEGFPDMNLENEEMTLAVNELTTTLDEFKTEADVVSTTIESLDAVTEDAASLSEDLITADATVSTLVVILKVSVKIPYVGKLLQPAKMFFELLEKSLSMTEKPVEKGDKKKLDRRLYPLMGF